MGTTYSIQYGGLNAENYSEEIDSILFVLDKLALSTYSDSSTISVFNRNRHLTLKKEDAIGRHFIQNLKKARMVYEQSNGAFDPTVMPLVNYWGFGFEERFNSSRDTGRIASILQYVGLNLLQDSTNQNDHVVWSDFDSLMLDFSAIAKGYSAEIVGNFLKEKKINDYYVEVGGELALSGKNQRGEAWVIGVNKPTMDSKVTQIYRKMQLTDCYVASSGNYRNYYESEDGIISHTINPKTGLPERNSILSTTIIAKDGALADAWATAGMVIGWPYFLGIAEKNEDIEAYIIFSDQQGSIRDTFTTGAKDFLLP